MTLNGIDSKKIEDFRAQAKETWGNTEAYREFEEKDRGRTEDDHKMIASQMMDIFAEFCSVKDQSPDSDEAIAVVKKLQEFITKHYYRCTDEILAGLGKAYGAGGEFTKNINETAGDGAAEFASLAIECYCKR